MNRVNRDQEQMTEPESDEPASEAPSDDAAEPSPQDEQRSDQATVAERLNRVARYAAGGGAGQDKSGANETKGAKHARSLKDPAVPAAGGASPHETLTVGRRIRLIAKMCECAELMVHGYLEATARTKILRVAEGGCFIGTAEVEFAEISGHFEGKLTATKKLLIHPSGIVSGTARYQEIVIEAGGQITGNSQSLASQAAAAKDKPARKPTAS